MIIHLHLVRLVSDIHFTIVECLRVHMHIGVNLHMLRLISKLYLTVIEILKVHLHAVRHISDMNITVYESMIAHLHIVRFISSSTSLLSNAWELICTLSDWSVTSISVLEKPEDSISMQANTPVVCTSFLSNPSDFTFTWSDSSVTSSSLFVESVWIHLEIITITSNIRTSVFKSLIVNLYMFWLINDKHLTVFVSLRFHKNMVRLIRDKHFSFGEAWTVHICAVKHTSGIYIILVASLKFTFMRSDSSGYALHSSGILEISPACCLSSLTST